MASIQFDCHLHQYDIPKNKHKCYCHANSKADLSVLLNPHYLSIVNPRRCLTGLTCKQKTCKIETISTNCYIPTWQWFQIMVPTTVTQFPSQNFNVCGFCHTNVRAMVRIMIPGSLLRNEIQFKNDISWQQELNSGFIKASTNVVRFQWRIQTFTDGGANRELGLSMPCLGI